MFSSLTREQKQRREALREAKTILRMTHEEFDPEGIRSLADYILGSKEVPVRPSSDFSSHGGVSFE